MRGATVWYAHPTLSRPLTVLGVERKWFFGALTLGLAIWNALASILAGLLIFGVLYAAGLIAWRRDPAMLAIIIASKNSRARYDPGQLPKSRVELVE